MQTLSASGVSKAYGDKQLFQDLDFLINEGDRIGLIGVNGTGKTTLLNGLAGRDGFDQGMVQTPKQYRMAYLAQQPALDLTKPIMDAVYGGQGAVFAALRKYQRALAAYTEAPLDQAAQSAYTKAEAEMNTVDGWSVDTDIKTILTQLHIDDLTQTIGSLSGGQQKRVGLAQVLIEAPDLLLLDEPTNHLDFDSIAWLEARLARYKGALLVVTHDRYFLDRVANQIWALDRGRLRRYPGNYESYVEQKATQDAQEAATAHKQTQLYQQELAWMRAGAQARSTKQQARINRFNELQDTLAATPAPPGEATLTVAATRLGKQVLTFEHADLALGEKRILQDFSWLVQPGQRIGITGLNGAGKSTLLNAIAGQQALDAGTLSLGATVKLGYYTQMNQAMDPTQRVIAYLQDSGEEVVTAGGEHISVTQLLEQFLFPRSMHGALVGRLSGGEKRRLYLLKLLMQQPNVLLLDEPTNDLDITTLTVLEDYLLHFPGTVITVSHDRYFLDKVATHLLVFEGDGVIDRYIGRFTDYLKQAPTVPTTEAKKPALPAAASETQEAPPVAKVKLTYAERLEYDRLQASMAELEAAIAKAEAEMATVPGTDYARLGDMQQQIDEWNQELETQFDRFADLDAYVD